MYEKIVVPLDGSKLAEVALPYAEELGGKMGSDVTLLTVLASADIAEYEQYYQYAEKIVEVTRYHANKYHNGSGKSVTVDTVNRTGYPAEAIMQYVSCLPFQLVVMASHGRSGVSRWAVGSVADKVVRATKSQSVMLIRANGSRSDIREKRILKKALVPLDGSLRSEAVIPYITKMAAKLDMELTLLQVLPQRNHSYEVAETYLQDTCKRLARKGVSAGYRVGLGPVADQIIDLADELALDLVAMSTRGVGSAKPWSLGSVAQKVFLGGNTPILLVKR
ncbi:MAG: universal stress protein [Chloroflexota bacterium]